MKKLILLYIVFYIGMSTLLITCASKQRQVNREHNKITRQIIKKATPVFVDYQAQKYVLEFYKEAESRGIRTEVIKENIDDIIFYPLEQGYYGFYSPQNRQVVINVVYANDSIILKKVLYHELGHVFGKFHTFSGIMQTGLYPKTILSRYSPAHGGTNEQWEKDKEDLWGSILLDLDKSK